MTLLDRLQAHRGGLLLIKTQLFWYDGRGWDRSPGRVCLVLDATTDPPAAVPDYPEAPATDAEAAATAALLLLDGSPQWIWVSDCDVELLT